MERTRARVWVAPHAAEVTRCLRSACGSEAGSSVPRRALQFKNKYLTEMCSGSAEGSFSMLADSCITELKAQGPSRSCNES